MTHVITTRARWISRGIRAALGLFLLIDGAFKLVRPPPILEAALHLGYSDDAIFAIGLILIICTLLFLIPRTAILGAIVLTGYFGGALASHVRVDDGPVPLLFVATFGVLAWWSLYLIDPRVRALLGAGPDGDRGAQLPIPEPPRDGGVGPQD